MRHYCLLGVEVTHYKCRRLGYNRRVLKADPGLQIQNSIDLNNEKNYLSCKLVYCIDYISKKFVFDVMLIALKAVQMYHSRVCQP